MSQCEEYVHLRDGRQGQGGYRCDGDAKYAMQLNGKRIERVCGTHRNVLLRIDGWEQIALRLELYLKASVTIEYGGDPIARITFIESEMTDLLNEFGEHAHVSLSQTRDRTGEA